MHHRIWISVLLALIAVRCTFNDLINELENGDLLDRNEETLLQNLASPALYVPSMLLKRPCYKAQASWEAPSHTSSFSSLKANNFSILPGSCVTRLYFKRYKSWLDKRIDFFLVPCERNARLRFVARGCWGVSRRGSVVSAVPLWLSLPTSQRKVQGLPFLFSTHHEDQVTASSPRQRIHSGKMTNVGGKSDMP